MKGLGCLRTKKVGDEMVVAPRVKKEAWTREREMILNDDGRQCVPCDAVGAAISESPSIPDPTRRSLDTSLGTR